MGCRRIIISKSDYEQAGCMLLSNVEIQRTKVRKIDFGIPFVGYLPIFKLLSSDTGRLCATLASTLLRMKRDFPCGKAKVESCRSWFKVLRHTESYATVSGRDGITRDLSYATLLFISPCRKWPMTTIMKRPESKAPESSIASCLGYAASPT